MYLCEIDFPQSKHCKCFEELPRSFFQREDYASLEIITLCYLDTKGWITNILKIPCISYLEWLVRTRNDRFSSQHHKTGNIVCVILYKGVGSLFSRKEKKGKVTQIQYELALPGCFLQEYPVHKVEQLMN